MVILSIGMRSATDVPETEITNGLVRAKLYLPDAEKGYYRGTRFDWSGVVASLDYKGHTYHGKWFDTYSPTLHDAVMGPVEEFGPLGYTHVKPGGTFVKIGVGSLIRPDEKPYNAFAYYPIANPGVWAITKKADQVQFVHTLADTAYAYEYRKTLALTKNKPALVITHSLKNIGNRPIETTSYNHNFFVIDQQPTGTGYAIKFPVSALSTDGGKGVTDRVRFQDGQLAYLSDLTKGESVYYPNLGNGQPMRYNITVDNTKTGAGVTVTGDRDISRMVYWSSSTTVSPEPYVTIKIEPGQTFSWQIAYQYYVK
ncbi:MAG: hypothetical protein J0I82_08360 [Spirosoma sp.]|nr:hypothetical protein [Spirosoma sp.]